MKKQEAVMLFLNKGYLPSPDFLTLESLDVPDFLSSFQKNIPAKDRPVILHKDFVQIIHNKPSADVNWLEFEKSRVMYEKGKNKHMYKTFLDLLSYHSDTTSKKRIDSLMAEVKKPEAVASAIERDEKIDNNVILVNHYKEDSQKRTVKDFVSYFKVRYNFLKGVLQQRPELQQTISISRAVRKQAMEQASIIGLVYSKHMTANGNLLFTVEDVTGSIKVLVNHNNPNLFALAEKICVDEVIGVTGFVKHNLLFSNALFFPDVPTPSKELKQCGEEVLAAFISDIHFGSVDFLEDNFLKFVQWLNSTSGTEQQKHLAKKVKYLFVLGDVVDGVGVYPGQEKNLKYLDIREQYKLAYKLLSQIRDDIKIIMCPGQHDAVRVTEPQPCISETYAASLCSLPNLIRVSNPCFVNIHSSQQFEGFNVLMYHGASFHYYIDNVPLLRQNMARDNPGEILKLLLQKRHLAPSHSSTTYVPYTDDDPLLIKKIPDIIVSGDMHKSDISTYNGIVVINSSCWQAKTDFQEKTGNNPDPCKVPLFNLKTREITMLNFAEPPSVA